jgi:hypothetical protein
VTATLSHSARGSGPPATASGLMRRMTRAARSVRRGGGTGPVVGATGGKPRPACVRPDRRVVRGRCACGRAASRLCHCCRAKHLNTAAVAGRVAASSAKGLGTRWLAPTATRVARAAARRGNRYPRPRNWRSRPAGLPVRSSSALFNCPRDNGQDPTAFRQAVRLRAGPPTEIADSPAAWGQMPAGRPLPARRGSGRGRRCARPPAQ